jgi:Mn-containing catalase
MFHHQKELAYTVRVDKPNPVFGRMLQQAIGGPEGEMRVALQYLFQGWNYRGPKKYRDMIIATGTEELGHIELLATAVAMNLEGAPSAGIDDVVTNPAAAARMGALEPRHFLSAGNGAMPADANGVPFNAASIDTGGNLIADMRANVAVEAIGRTLALRLLELTDDPGMKDMLKFIIARDTMHQQQWLAVLEELPQEQALNAPGDYDNEDEYKQYAYSYFNHGDVPIDPSARWATGPSLDGKGEFQVIDPPPLLGEEPELALGPPATHSGVEATGETPASSMVDRVAGGVKDAVEKVAP